MDTFQEEIEGDGSVPVSAGSAEQMIGAGWVSPVVPVLQIYSFGVLWILMHICEVIRLPAGLE